jgi:cytochrome c oxidase subunit 2
VDYLHYFVVTVTMAASLLLFVAVILLCVRYRETKPGASTPIVKPSVRFEVVIITVPLLFFLGWAVIGFKDYIWYTHTPKNAMDVTGKKWMWHFAYPDGPNGNAVLTVPANRPVRLLMTSRDVIHSFFVPEFRIKQDVIPGRYTELWFEAPKPGQYNIFCTEYCGTWHSDMRGRVVVLPPAEFDAWHERARQGLADRQDTSETGEDSPLGSLVAYGQRVAAAQGCFKCHTVDGTPHIGPTWVDLYQRKTLLTTGQSVVADEAYLTESMMDPFLKVVQGYAQVMPSFRGKLTAPESAALVEFIKSLRRDTLQNLPSKEPVYGPITRQ